MQRACNANCTRDSSRPYRQFHLHFQGHPTTTPLRHSYVYERGRGHQTHVGATGSTCRQHINRARTHAQATRQHDMNSAKGANLKRGPSSARSGKRLRATSDSIRHARTAHARRRAAQSGTKEPPAPLAPETREGRRQVSSTNHEVI